MRFPSVKQFRAFLLVAETGSVSVAARALSLTQPAISQQLRELERTLSVRLFERANGKSIPTAIGQALIEPAQRTVAAAEDAMALAAELKRGDAGQIKIGAGATACIHLLPAVLEAVKTAMPRLSIKVIVGDTADLLPQVQAGGLDIGLMTLPPSTTSLLSYTPLFCEALVAILPEQAGIFSNGISAQELAQFPFIAYRSGGDTRAITDAWFGASAVSITPIMELGSFEAIKVLVGAGLGAAIVPKLTLATPTPATLTHSLNPPLLRTVGYVVRQDKIMDHGFRLLVRHLEALPTP